MPETDTPERVKPFAWVDKPGVKDALASDLPVRTVARLAGVTHQTIGNYRNKHLKPAAELVSKAQMLDNLVAKANSPDDLAQSLARHPFLLRANDLWETCKRNVDSAEKSVRVIETPAGALPIGQDYGALSSMLAQAHKNLELYGKGTGLFNDNQVGPNVTMNIVIMSPGNVDDCRQPSGNLPASSDSCQTIEVEAEESK